MQQAKIVRRMIETGGEELSPGDMSWWSYFLLSLIIRGPESVAALKTAAAAMWNAADPKNQADYAKLRGPGDPLTLEDWLAEDSASGPAAGQRLGQKILRSLVMNANVADHLKSMHWYVITTNKSDPPFVLSDRPLFSSNGLKKENGQLILPIAPHSLFCAFNDRNFADAVRFMPPDELIEMSRKLVAVRAQKFIYANTSKEREFVGQWLGYERTPSMGETLARRWISEGLPSPGEDED